MRRWLWLSLIWAMVGCAGKKTVNDAWDSSPRACDGPATNACTPLPQELSETDRVEAGLRRSEMGEDVQFYRILRREPKLTAVLVHGILGHASDFRRQFSRPVPGFNFLAFDRAGYGRSTNRSQLSTLAFHAENAQSFLKTDPNLPFVLVGHSYGGAIALQLALAHPERVNGLVLVNAVLDPDLAAALGIQSVLESAGLLPQMLHQSNSDLIRLKAGLEELAPHIGSLNIPVELIHGGVDDIVAPAHVEYLKSQLQIAGKENLVHVEIYSECGHRIPDQNPERLNRALERIKKRVLELPKS